MPSFLQPDHPGLASPVEPGSEGPGLIDIVITCSGTPPSVSQRSHGHGLSPRAYGGL